MLIIWNTVDGRPSIEEVDTTEKSSIASENPMKTSIYNSSEEVKNVNTTLENQDTSSSVAQLIPRRGIPIPVPIGGGAIAGIVVGSVVGGIFLLVCIGCICYGVVEALL